MAGNQGCFTFIDLAGFDRRLTHKITRMQPEREARKVKVTGDLIAEVPSAIQEQIDNSLVALRDMLTHFNRNTRIQTD